MLFRSEWNLRDGEEDPDAPRTWSYRVVRPAGSVLSAITQSADVEDTAGFDRNTASVPGLGERARDLLAWSGAPPTTKSFALVVDDPDAPDPKAPKMTWVHWVLYDIPAESPGLPAGLPRNPRLEDGSAQGRCWGVHRFSRLGYQGPAPPPGPAGGAPRQAAVARNTPVGTVVPPGPRHPRARRGHHRRRRSRLPVVVRPQGGVTTAGPSGRTVRGTCDDSAGCERLLFRHDSPSPPPVARSPAR